jgi:prevent-host-death family protein
MRSGSVAELKNRLRKYLALAKGGEEIIIRDRNLPVAKLVSFFLLKKASKKICS